VISLIFVPLAWSVLRWQHKRWVLILATALAAIALLGNVPFLIEDLAHPESGWGFCAGCAVMLTAIVAIIAGIAATLRLPDGSARAVVGGAAVLGVLAVVVALVATMGWTAMHSAGGHRGLAKGVKYPETVTAKAGNVAFFVENEDRVRHTFVIADADVEQELPASANRRVEVTLKAGSYEFHCSVMGHETMKGRSSSPVATHGRSRRASRRRPG